MQRNARNAPTKMVIIHTGGASGADLLWSNSLGDDHELVVHTFAGHSICKPRGKYTPIYVSTHDYIEDLQAIQIVLRRSAPASSYVRKLLARNISIAHNAQCVYALTKTTNGKVSGGSAYACQFALMHGVTVYVYNGKNWIDLHTGTACKPPRVSTFDSVACIGSRDLPPHCKSAIRDVL